MSSEEKKKRKGLLDRIEYAGNKLPDPVTIFLLISLVILLCSAIFSGVSEINPATGEAVTITNLITKDGFVKIIQELPNNLKNFPPFTLVLVIMLGIGLCEKTGFLEVLIRQLIIKAPTKMLLPLVFFIGIMANMAGDVGFIVIPPLAAMMFLSLGKNPIAGLIAAYAAVAGGFTANLMINTTEVILLGFAERAAQTIDPNWIGNPAFNYYFMVVSTLLLIPVGVVINNKIVEPRLGVYKGDLKYQSEEIKDNEKKGLKMSGIATLIFLIVLGLLTIPSGSIFRHPETDSLIVLSPFLFSLVPIITLFFMNAGLFYGVGSGVIKSDRDAIRCMIEGVKSMSGFIVFAFFAGQMIAWFDWSRIGPVVAIKGANFLQNIGFEGIPLLLMFILITSLINIMISSNSAKFAILAPVFIPMFMLMGISPSGTTIAYRIADSITNPITPMMVYLAIIISIAKQYDEKFGIGSVIASVLPYSIAFTVMWVLQLIIWYVLKLPLGPGFYFQM